MSGRGSSWTVRDVSERGWTAIQGIHTKMIGALTQRSGPPLLLTTPGASLTHEALFTASVARPYDAVQGLVPGLAGMHDAADFLNARLAPGLLVEVGPGDEVSIFGSGRRSRDTRALDPAVPSATLLA